MRSIIDELRSTDKFESAIPKLHYFVQRHPSIQLQTYLAELSAHFGNFIKSHLEAFEKSLAETGSTPNKHMSSRKVSGSQPQDDPDAY